MFGVFQFNFSAINPKQNTTTVLNDDYCGYRITDIYQQHHFSYKEQINLFVSYNYLFIYIFVSTRNGLH